MKNAIRWLPASIGTFLLGFYVGSPAFAQASQTAQRCVAGAIVIAVVIVTAFLCAITRSRKPQQKSGGFGQTARTRTGRS